jgi:hypothetical protein
MTGKTPGVIPWFLLVVYFAQKHSWLFLNVVYLQGDISDC